MLAHSLNRAVTGYYVKHDPLNSSSLNAPTYCKLVRIESKDK